ncbi:small integral membrane protein 35-like isoform X2 [Pristis pectinata]|uniref:small integral membrane protein 35-like isoform X2 n=1 Tax=Pristis pectinata TaxID=685728 RepID=UPI00223CBC86|nr:small integral membrane protein 35-like isoform X2 [Pristis pectinata]
MDHPFQKLATVVPSGEILLRVQRQVLPTNHTEAGNYGSVNTRGVIIAICLLLLVIVSLAVLFTLYYRRGRCFKRPKLKFSQNILRELTLIQLEFDPPFTVSGMMKTMGNRGSDQQFQYHNMRTREEDFSQANE